MKSLDLDMLNWRCNEPFIWGCSVGSWSDRSDYKGQIPDLQFIGTEVELNL